MTMNSNVSTMAMVHRLVREYTQEELCQCVTELISKQSNYCLNGNEADDILNVLARAGFVKQLMTQGMSLHESMRELGRRMRALSGESS
jgi:hypothetical protein